MTVARGGLLVFCLAASSARGIEPRRLLLDPPRLDFGALVPADAPPAGLTEGQIGWLAFAADGLLEAWISASETALVYFGGGLLTLGNGGGGADIVAVGLMLLLHPLLDAFLVDAVARVSERFQPSFFATLGGAYLGCVLGALGFVLSVVVLQSWPVVELIVASVLNALLPAAGAELAEVWSKQPIEGQPRLAARAAPPSPLLAERANAPAWQTAVADPLARWAF